MVRAPEAIPCRRVPGPNVCHLFWERFAAIMKKYFYRALLPLLLVSLYFSTGAGALDPLRVKVAVLKNFPPQYVTSETGRPQGFAVDTIEAIAELANLEIDYLVKDSWAEMFAAVKSGEADLIPNQGITDRRRQWFAFSRPVETFAVSIFTRIHENGIATLQDLAGKKTAVVKLNIGERLVKNEPAIQTQKYDHAEEALFGLLSGNVDALIFPEPVLWKIARDAGIDNRIKVVGKSLKEVRRGVSVSRENRLLLERIDRAVEKFVGSERYHRIYTRWYGRPEPYWTSGKVAVIFTVLLAAAVFLMGFWRYHSVMRLNRELQRNIERLKTAEENLQAAHDSLERQVKQRTEQLAQSLGELEALFDNTQVGIMMLKGGRIFYKGNQRLADILGYESPKEMQGLSMQALHLNEKRFESFGRRYYAKLSNKKMLQIEYELKHKEGTPVWCTLSGKALDPAVPADLTKGVIWVVDDISKKKQGELEREKLLSELQKALQDVKQLSGLLPICSHCKKIRDDKGYWNQLETYIQAHSEAQFSHGICRECAARLYPDFDIYED